MTGFLLAGATCPMCGRSREGVFVRSFDGSDLVCRACREGEGLPTAPAFPRDRGAQPRLSPTETIIGPGALPAVVFGGRVTGSGEVAGPVLRRTLRRVP